MTTARVELTAGDLAADLEARPPSPPTPPPAALRPPGAPGATMRPTTRRDVLGFMCMVVGMFMAILDIQIVSSSLTEIQAGLSASADEITWVQTAYLIAEVVMIPLSGYLSRAFSTRVLFVASSFGFTLMSLACAFSTSIGGMVVARALQGFIGGAMIPTVFASSFLLFPGSKRAQVGVVMGLVATMAPTLGPTLGGYLTAAFSWHWLFLINILPGIAVTLGVWALVDIDKGDPQLIRRFDGLGLLLMAVFLGSVEYVLEEGPRNDWFQDDTICTLAAVAVAGGAAFFARVLTHASPVVDLRAFHDRNFALGCLFSFLLGIGLYGAVYILPVFLGQVLHYNSLEIGVTVMVTGIAQFFSGPIAGMLSRKMDPRVMLGIGLALFATGMYLFSGLTSDVGYGDLVLPQVLRGLALMLCFIPINTLTLGTLPPHEVKNASGLYNLMRNLGGAIGLAGINTVLTERLALHGDRLRDLMTAGRIGVADWLSGMSTTLADRIPGDSDKAALSMLRQMVHRQANVLSINDVLLMMAGVFVFALMLLPILAKPRAAGGGGGGH